jgi:hypothetical protein
MRLCRMSMGLARVLRPAGMICVVVVLGGRLVRLGSLLVVVGGLGVSSLGHFLFPLNDRSLSIGGCLGSYRGGVVTERQVTFNSFAGTDRLPNVPASG